MPVSAMATAQPVIDAVQSVQRLHGQRRVVAHLRHVGGGEPGRGDARGHDDPRARRAPPVAPATVAARPAASVRRTDAR